MTSATDVYLAARDQLVELRTERDGAVAEFRLPDVGPAFCWAVDWFDAIALDNDRPALVIAEEAGASSPTTFDEMRCHSNRLARWLSGRGVAKGDSVVVMLGNQVELWVSMLAVMKVGAVVMPTTSAVEPAELVDRIERRGRTPRDRQCRGDRQVRPRPGRLHTHLCRGR